MNNFKWESRWITNHILKYFLKKCMKVMTVFLPLIPTIVQLTGQTLERVRGWNKVCPPWAFLLPFNELGTRHQLLCDQLSQSLGQSAAISYGCQNPNIRPPLASWLKLRLPGCWTLWWFSKVPPDQSKPRFWQETNGI